METINLNQAAGVSLSPEKMGKVKGGYYVVIESFKMLGKNKSIMMFPLFSMIVELLLVAAFLGVYFYYFGFSGFSREALDKIETQGMSAVYYLYLFIFYIVSIFVASFFQAGLVAVVSGQINGKKLTFGDGINVAMAHIWKIFFWSSLAATVGVVLQFISDRFKFLGRLVASILGFAWDIITFFIVPVLILENETIGGSIKRSGLIFKNKWGQTLIANFSTGLFFGILLIVGVVVIFAGIIFSAANSWFLFALLIAFVVYILMIIVLSATIEGIYRVVLYEYAAHEKLPESFKQELIVNAIKTGK